MKHQQTISVNARERTGKIKDTVPAKAKFDTYIRRHQREMGPVNQGQHQQIPTPTNDDTDINEQGRRQKCEDDDTKEPE